MRNKLNQLEKEGKWVFHGSGHKLKILEPRQAHNYPKAGSDKEKIPDDKPAVFASPFADVAIFMAIINRNNAQKGSRSGFSANADGSFEFRATQATMDQIKNAKGYVYIFDKEKFKPRSSTEVLSYEAVKPNEIIEVTEKDLPEGIVIKDF